MAATIIEKAGATPAFLDYHPSWAPTPYPGVICASINDAVVHGIPDQTRLADGDLVSIDCGAFVGGRCGDAAVSFVVGTPRSRDLELIAATDAALQRGIEAAQPGQQLGDVSHAIGVGARRTVTASSPTMAATVSAGPCTKTLWWRTKAGPVAATGYDRAWSSPSSPCSSPTEPTST